MFADHSVCLRIYEDIRLEAKGRSLEQPYWGSCGFYYVKVWKKWYICVPLLIMKQVLMQLWMMNPKNELLMKKFKRILTF